MTEDPLEIPQLRQVDREKPVQVAFIVGISKFKLRSRGIVIHLMAVLHDGKHYRHNETIYFGDKWKWKLDAWKKALWIPPEVTEDILLEDPQFYFMVGYLRWALYGKFGCKTPGNDFFSLDGARAFPLTPEHGIEYFAQRWMSWKAKHGKHRNSPTVDTGKIPGLIQDIRGKVDELEAAYHLGPIMALPGAPKRVTGPSPYSIDKTKVETVSDFI